MLLTMMMPKQSTVPHLLRYFAERVPGAGRTQMVKFLYLADLEARRWIGEPLTDLQYIWHDHGPFNSQILVYLDLLSSAGYLDEIVQEYPNGTRGAHITATDKPLPTAGDFTLTDDQMAILEHIASAYGRMPLRKLLKDVVYETLPMKDAQERDAKGHLLRMELVDNEARRQGFDLNRIRRSVQNLNEGKGRRLSEMLAQQQE